MPWMHELRSENLAVCLQWEMGMGVLLPSRLGDLGDRRKLPSGVRGRAPAKKQVLEYLELEKNTPDFTSRLFPDFFHFPWTLEFPDFSRFSRWVVTLKHAGYVVEGIGLPNWLCTLCWLCWCATHKSWWCQMRQHIHLKDTYSTRLAEFPTDSCSLPPDLQSASFSPKSFQTVSLGGSNRHAWLLSEYC